MDEQRNRITNRAPIVSGTIRTEEEVYNDNGGGPGGDIYYKGAWMLHTLRGLIGDKAFFDATRLLVYGRTDPKPGNVAPRYGSTADFERAVAHVTGRDYRWFFDVYLRQAALPELIATRNGDRLDLRWAAPNGLPFPMPVEVKVDGRIEQVAMSGGSGTLTVPADAHVTLDPMARVLKRSAAVEAYLAWQAAHRDQR
jgi:aminopeptidase N